MAQGHLSSLCYTMPGRVCRPQPWSPADPRPVHSSYESSHHQPWVWMWASVAAPWPSLQRGHWELSATGTAWPAAPRPPQPVVGPLSSCSLHTDLASRCPAGAWGSSGWGLAGPVPHQKATDTGQSCRAGCFSSLAGRAPVGLLKGFPCCRAWTLGARASAVAAHRLSSCGSQALEHWLGSSGTRA